jgi:hypothetical protein
LRKDRRTSHGSIGLVYIGQLGIALTPTSLDWEYPRTMADPPPERPNSLSEWFWSIVQTANHDREALREILDGILNERILQFAMEFRAAADCLWSPPFTDHLRYSSDDDIQDMSYWVVSRGQELWASVWEHPEQLTSLEEATAFKGSLWTVAEGLLRNRLGDAYDDDSYRDVNEALGEFNARNHATIAAYFEAQPPY